MNPLSPPPVTSVHGTDLPAYLSNGLIGLRVLEVPLAPGVTLINGFSAPHPVIDAEAAAQAPFPVAGDIAIGKVRLRRSPELARFVEQAYDFGCGELTTRFRFAADGVTADVSVMTFCHRVHPTLVLQEVVVEVDAPCELSLEATVDQRQVFGSTQRRRIGDPATGDADGSMAWLPSRGALPCGIAYVTELVGDPDVLVTLEDSGPQAPLASVYRIPARPGHAYRLRQVASLVPGILHPEPDLEAVRLVTRAASAGFDRLREENRAAWDDLWRGRVVIEADDDRWQALADAAFFYLNCSVHRSAPSSTSIYGLAQWNDYHYYYGHVMWDVDFFCVPPLTLTQPDAARALIEFRSQTARGARSTAKLLGRRGLQFPWESGPSHGGESSPGTAKASWFEDHVSLDVAWAFAQFVHATGDPRFLADDAWPVLSGVADWLVSRVTREGDRIRFLETMGIAERETPVDDDAYTLMLASVVLREAIASAERLGRAVDDSWREVAAGIAVRPSAATGAVLSHEGFHPRQEKGATPGPLAGMFPVWYPLPPATAQATLDYYLRLAPEYVGSPMLSSLYPVWACWAGDRDLAAELLESGYAAFVGGRFLQTLEMSPAMFPDAPRSGPFFANMGGFLMGLMLGLPGIRLGAGSPETWPAREVALPAGWRSIHIERAWVRGRPMSITARHGDARARIGAPHGTTGAERRSGGALAGVS